jgi:mRNA-degrading endonuclease toxin of MazEF toxin-antitoxin module
VKRGEIWWADLGPYRPREQTGRRPVVVWQSNALSGVLQSVLVVPLTTNMERANLAGTALVNASPDGPRDSSVALAFQLRAIPKQVAQSLACQRLCGFSTIQHQAHHSGINNVWMFFK